MSRFYLRSLFVAGVIGSCVSLVGRPVQGEEPVLEFLHAAQDNGYGEVAVYYLEGLQKSGKVPGELLETFDLEMCNSLRVSVNESFNQEESDDRTKQAQTYLDKFLKEHPDHPEVVAALVAAGSLAFDDGLSKMRIAKLSKDEAATTKLHTEARTLFEASRPRFTQAADLYAKRLSQLKESSQEAPKPGTPQSKIEKQKEQVTRAMADWIDTRFKGALVDYYIGQTYDAKDAGTPAAPQIDPKTKKPIVAKPQGPRAKALEAAGKAFDEIYQENRNEIEVGRVLAGMYAHMWHGKTAQELGNDKLAQDIYEEVLSATAGDEKSTQATGLEPLFAQVEYFRFIIVQKNEGSEVFAKQAIDWRTKASAAVRDTEGYVSVSLELAKAFIAEGEKQPADKQKKYMDEARKILEELERRKSEHLAEILSLLRTLRKKSGTVEDPKTFAQAMAIADEAMKSEDYETARDMYGKAVAFNDKVKEKDQTEVARARDQVDYAKLGIGRAHYDKGEFKEALALAGEVAKNTTAPAAATAASLGLSVRFAQYAAAPDAAAQQQGLLDLERAADFMLTNWPNSEPADDARIAKGQLKLVQGQLPDAIAMFETVNPRSVRYALAMYQAAQTHWRLFQMEKAKENGIRDDEVMNNHRAKAEEELRSGLALEQKAQKGGEMSKNQIDTQLLLAELYLDGGQAKESAELAQPLMDNLKANPPQDLDNTVLRSYVAALRAAKELRDTTKMSEICNQFTASVQDKDDPKLNNVLTALFARMLVDEMKRAQAELIQADAPLVKEDAQKKVDAVKVVLGTLIEFLATRQNHNNPVVSFIFIADTAAELEKPDLAQPLYDKVVKMIEDPAPENTLKNDPQMKAACTRIRAQVIGLSRRKGDFQTALDAAEGLIKTNPKSLEPLMEKGRILQAWSETNPAKFADAVGHWTYLRNTLARMPKKPSQFYEVVYNAANCLYQDAKKNNNDAKKLKDAEGLLGGTLLNSPNLDGPDRVAQYEDLLKQINPDKYKNKKSTTGAAAPAPAPAPSAAAGS